MLNHFFQILTDILIECPLCNICHSFNQITDLIIHLKQQHKMSITQLETQFQDPRYYLALVQNEIQKDPNYIKNNFQPRQSDGCLVLQKNEHDKMLRTYAFMFQRRRALEQLNYEASEQASYNCFFCQKLIKGTWQQILYHFTDSHHLRVGYRAGIVYIEKLLNVLFKYYNDKKCICCKQCFQTQHQLVNHLKQEKHLRFNDKYDQQYDCFYIDQYRELKFSKNQQEDTSEDNDIEQIEENQEYDQIPLQYLQIMEQIPRSSSYKNVQTQISCLFCDYKTQNSIIMKSHLRDQHEFIWNKQIYGNYYNQIKLINYIRCQLQNQLCPWCNQYIDNTDLKQLNQHIKQHLDQNQQIQQIESEQYLIPQIQNEQIYQLIDQNVDTANEEQNFVVE